jgi:hypothetical protein
MDRMDVDQPSSSSKRRAASPSAPSSSKRRAENLLSDDEEKRIIAKMRYLFYEDDKWSGTLRLVLLSLAKELQSTSKKASFISLPENLVDNLSKKELKEWKSDMQNGIENDDWHDLICTYISDYQIIRWHFNRDLRSSLYAISICRNRVIRKRADY